MRELYRLSDHHLLAKLVPTFADRGCRVVSTTDPHGRILDFLDRSCYYFFRVAPQFYWRGWVNPVSDTLLLRKSGSTENLTRDPCICSQELWPLDHRGSPEHYSHGLYMLQMVRIQLILATPSRQSSEQHPLTLTPFVCWFQEHREYPPLLQES
jgi:hypothetical protein